MACYEFMRKAAELGYSTPENTVDAGGTEAYRKQEEWVRRQQHLQQQQEKLRQHLWVLQSSTGPPLPSLANIAEQLDAMETKPSVDALLNVHAYRAAGQEPDVLESIRPQSAGTSPSGATKRRRDESMQFQRDDDNPNHIRTHWSTGHWVRGALLPVYRPPPRTCFLALSLTVGPCMSLLQRLALDEGCWPQRSRSTPSPTPIHVAFADSTASTHYSKTPDLEQAIRRRKRRRGRSHKVVNPVAVIAQNDSAMVVNPAVSFATNPSPCEG